MKNAKYKYNKKKKKNEIQTLEIPYSRTQYQMHVSTRQYRTISVWMSFGSMTAPTHAMEVCKWTGVRMMAWIIVENL